jgi:tetratricopeptide (TPR) repeat protein
MLCAMRRRALVGIVSFGAAALISAVGTGLIVERGWGKAIAWLIAEPAPVPKPLAHPIPTTPPSTDDLWVGKDGTDRYGYPTRQVSLLGVQRLLRARRFDELTQHVTELTRAAELEPRKEQWAVDAFAAFGFPDPELGTLLDVWVAHSPRSFAPYAARDVYRSKLAVFYLGGVDWEDTSEAQREAYRKAMGRANRDRLRSLALYSNALAPNLQRLRHARGTAEADAEFAHTNARFPLSFAVYFERSFALAQRADAREAIEALATRARSNHSKNPMLAVVEGLADFQRARILLKEKNHSGALAAIDRALEHGEHPEFRALRGEAAVGLGDFVTASTELQRVLAVTPHDVTALDQLRYVERALSRHEEAGEACLQLALIDPLVDLRLRNACASWLAYAGRRHARAGRPREALRAFDKALLLEPHHTETRADRTALLRRGDPNQNLAELTSLRERAEREGTFEAYRRLDEALSERGRFDEVIANWTRYIIEHAREEHPRACASAHHFRSHARASVCDPAGAASDAGYACELGEPAACKDAEALRQRASMKADDPAKRDARVSPNAPQRTERRITAGRTVPQPMERPSPPSRPAERRTSVPPQAVAASPRGPTPMLQPLVAGLR